VTGLPGWGVAPCGTSRPPGQSQSGSRVGFHRREVLGERHDLEFDLGCHIAALLRVEVADLDLEDEPAVLFVELHAADLPLAGCLTNDVGPVLLRNVETLQRDRDLATSFTLRDE
jgi:hypothetical protein